MSKLTQDRKTAAKLKWVGITVCLANLMAYAGLTAINSAKLEQESLLQHEANIGRVNALIKADVDRIYHTAKGWIFSLSKPDQQIVFQLERWFQQDVDAFEPLISNRAQATYHLEQIRQQGLAYFAALKKLAKNPPETDLVTIIETPANLPSPLNTSTPSPTPIVDEKLQTWVDFRKLHQDLTQSLSSSLEDHYSIVDTAVDQYIFLSWLTQSVIIVILGVDLLFIAALSVLAAWGPADVVDFLKQQATLPQKFGALVAVPLTTQLLAYAALAVLIVDAAAELTRNEKFVHSEDQARQLQATTFRALGAGQPLPSDPTNQVLVQLQRFASTSTKNQLVQNWITEIAFDFRKAMRLQPADRSNLIPHYGKPYSNELYLLLCERILGLERLSLPSVGQQSLWEKRRQILAAQAATFENMMLLVVVSLLVQIILSVASLKYFAEAVEARFRKVQLDIENYAQEQILQEPLPGSDEASALSRFFETMSNRIEEARKREQSMVANASDPIFSVTPQWIITEGNTACKALGLLDIQDGNYNLTTYLHPDDAASVISKLEQIANGSQSGSFECRISDSSSRFRDYLVAAQWSPDNQKFFCVCQDITSQKHLDRMKQDFVAMVSHDVRTPLSSITIFLEMVGDGTLGELSPEGTNTIKDIISRSKELTQLIKDLLDIERIQATRSSRSTANFDLQELTAVISQELEELCHSRGVSLEIHIPKGCLVGADKDKLAQACTTILVAAIKRAQETSTVNLHTIQADNQLTIEISWHQAPTQPPLDYTDFEAYHPHDNTVTLGGLSKLGLALSKTIIERFGGELQLLVEEPSYSCLLSLPSGHSAAATATAVSARTSA